MPNREKKFAVFDIDGTLYRWQLYHELVQTLALKGFFPGDIVTKLDDHWNQWRGGTIPFSRYEEFVIKAMTDNLPAVSAEDFDEACDSVVRQSAHKTHFYPKALLKKLKKQNYTIIAITGSQQELADRFCKLYDFDIVVGSKYERVKGRFTGKTEVMTVGCKPEILRDLVKKYELSWKDSYAIGDSDGDADFLELVNNPIAFNPSEGLFERAKLEGWPVVIERKNIAYTLKKGDDGFTLKDITVY